MNGRLPPGDAEIVSARHRADAVVGEQARLLTCMEEMLQLQREQFAVIRALLARVDQLEVEVRRISPSG
ncbi:hypothetical protein [Limnoglobus roseus]|uniref:Uncharacterized protein n=1 Tax=Limnoglobus roseus TaxID=2598579 RepID=A0A5C1AI79_9BACT|nr:hypothetical protein [Limnoglobus roseus]QEL17706.1 hypothetical protein PX52LOC_04705 [Limnoglobus roseus]